MAAPAQPRSSSAVSSRGREDAMERPPGRRRSSGMQRRRKGKVSGMQVGAALLVGPLAAACCTRVSAQQAEVDQLRVLVPLYARPGGECALFVVHKVAPHQLHVI